ncbi:hypothetical protein GQ473_01910 [archaeon]|nr:hypothetical protein [archaeon]
MDEKRKLREIGYAMALFIVLGVLVVLLNGTGFISTPLGYVVNTTISVSIAPELNHIFYEGESVNPSKDYVFQIGPITTDGLWHSYNSTYGGVFAGYDIGTYSDNNTNLFKLRNTGTRTIDVLIASSDFDNGVIGDGNYIDVNQFGGDFQIYIPEIGWRNVSDNNNRDEDGIKNNEELCIANNLVVGAEISGFDIRIRAWSDIDPGNYTAHIMVSVFESDNIDVCTGVGDYVLS